jgi:pimeloyl-ACP methyl ester carboxylesterase
MVTTQDRTVTAWRDEIDTRIKVAGDGPPVIFLHGAYGLQWDQFLDNLSQSHTVYAPEHPGTTPGAPDAVKPLDNLWDLVLYYYELFDKLGLESPAVIGHLRRHGRRRDRRHEPGAVKACPHRRNRPWRDDQPVRN